MKPTTWCVLAAILACPPIGYAQASASPDAFSPAVAEVLKALADQLLTEAERQHMVNRRMDTSIRGFESLVKDLTSNDLLPQGRGPQMKRFVAVLGMLNVAHVPNAGKYLEEARRKLQALRPNLHAADREIDIILKMLDDLLAKGKRQSNDEDLLTQLRLIIRKEQDVHQQTREWGKLLYQKPQDAETGREELKTKQEQVASMVRQFEDKLKESARTESDPLAKQDLTKASQAMEQQKVEEKLDQAAKDIETKKPIPAVQKQAEALEALKALEQMLQGDSLADALEEMKDSYQDLSDILARQEKLTQQTRDVPKDEFAKKSDPLQLEQRNIEKELEKTTEQMPEAASQDVRKPLEQAEQHMEDAQKEMAKDKQPEAVAQQEKAEESLKQAMKKLAEQIAESEQQLADQAESDEAAQELEQALEQTDSIYQRQEQLMQATQAAQQQELAQMSNQQQQLAEETKGLSEKAEQASEPLQEASSQMQQAQQSMEQSQQAQATQHQQQALQALQQARQSLQQALQQAQQATRVQPNSKTKKPQEKGERDFGKQKPRGPQVTDDQKLWEHLTPREREALKQKFAQRLPLEYRELLEDYYEALSK
ncbi:MAG TPA: hypothetical protein VM695_03240 [Phycisphaerae bacterium]|nr:hypothetical protein [Phycisphaerae bacterium]